MQKTSLDDFFSRLEAVERSKEDYVVPSTKMDKNEAETIKKYPGFAIFTKTPCLVTLKKAVSVIINTEWIYSLHWSEKTWVEDAKKDCKKRIEDVRKDLRDLESALMKLEDIK